MKEVRYFFDADMKGELPEEEVRHAVKVLRLTSGDTIFLMDGNGCYYEAEITTATGHRCFYKVIEKQPQSPAWSGHLHLAMAPTKMMDRVEWFAEKATEIGFDELTFLNCTNSERRVIKCERINKILISGMKQSHKAWKPLLNEMTDFKSFVKSPRCGQKFICHCYADEDVAENGSYTRPYLLDILKKGEPATVLIGPEGDFSIEEVKMALANGYQSVNLGKSRLRTETAALVAVHCMQIKNQN